VERWNPGTLDPDLVILIYGSGSVPVPFPDPYNFLKISEKKFNLLKHSMITTYLTLKFFKMPQKFGSDS
jgi:hypothetical protein